MAECGTHNDGVRLSKVFVIVIRVTGFFSTSWQLAAQFLTPFNRALNLSSSLQYYTAQQTLGVFAQQTGATPRVAGSSSFHQTPQHTCCLFSSTWWFFCSQENIHMSFSAMEMPEMVDWCCNGPSFRRVSIKDIELTIHEHESEIRGIRLVDHQWH